MPSLSNMIDRYGFNAKPSPLSIDPEIQTSPLRGTATVKLQCRASCWTTDESCQPAYLMQIPSLAAYT